MAFTQILISIAAFAVAIGVLVAFHEFGHFWLARRLGVKVLRYSIGFGKPLWGWTSRKSGTEYVISALPLGGYVKMLDEREGEVDPAERHLAFNTQPVWKRIAIVAAGPGFNFVFAVAAYWLVFMVGIVGMKPIVGHVAQGTPAFQAGLQRGDLIVSVDGHAAPTWDVARTDLLEAALDHHRAHLVVRGKDGQQRRVSLDLHGISSDPQKFYTQAGVTLYQPQIKPVIGRVESNSPAQRAGLRSGDRIVAIGGHAIQDWSALVKWVRAHPGAQTRVTVVRSGQRKTLPLSVGHVSSAGKTIGHIGAGVDVNRDLWQDLRAQQRYGPAHALTAGAGRTWQMTALTARMLWQMVVGHVSWRNISGPIDIAQYAGYTAQLGVSPFFSFLAIVSISLGVLNLLPVPVLDGGHLLYYAAELIKGKPLSERTQTIGQHIGLVLLIMLMSLAFYNDIARLVG